MIVWVKYGFESTPLKMYNTNVSSAVLLSFLRATCIKDLDDFCKQKTIQLSIELDALRRASVGRKSNLSLSVASLSDTAPSPAATAPLQAPASRPPSSSGAVRPTTPSALTTTRGGSNATTTVVENLSDEEIAMWAKKTTLEKQLDTINAAAKLVKELVAGVAWVDLVDQRCARMKLDEAGNTRVNTLLAARQQYAAVSVTKTEYGDLKVTPLVFQLVS